MNRDKPKLPVIRLLNDLADHFEALRRAGIDPATRGQILIDAIKNPNLNRNRKVPDMRVSETYGGNTLKAEDLPQSGMRVTIRNVTMKTFQDGDRERDKLILHFEETEKSLVVNVTNANMLVEMFGDETDDWLAQQIDLIVARVEFNGKRVPAIRVKERPKQRQRPPAQPTKRVMTQQEADELDGDAAMDDDIPFDDGAGHNVRKPRA